ncbi:MAG: type II toxin-antitoxin system death-on-curing family toxin [Elusimicrobiota bacterium]
MRFLTASEALFIHSAIIDETGGSHGLRDMGLLESALARPKQTFDGRDLYPTLHLKAAALATSLIKNHPFVDGNKRTAVASMAIFLKANDFILNCTNTELLRFTDLLVAGSLDIGHAADWIKQNTTRKHTSKR